MKIVIFGLGYVGTTSAVGLAQLGHDIIGVDVNPEKVALVNAGTSPIFEPGVPELLVEATAAKRLRATSDGSSAVAGADAAFVCVGTPSNNHGAIDDTHLGHVVMEIAAARHRSGRMIPIFIRSTALPETHARCMQWITEETSGQRPFYCVHPEFLRAGQAIADFKNPPKIVFGVSDDSVRTFAKQLYPGIDAPTTFTDPMTAALVKYADNIFHAVKITYTNEISMFAKANGVDARRVLDLVCQDVKLNLSSYYMRPGFAFGGSCLPKDLRAALAWSCQNMLNFPMLEQILASNERQVDRLVSRIFGSKARSAGLFGLAFKGGTDDLRESPLVTVAETLRGKGFAVSIYDPALRIERMIGRNKTFALQALPHLTEMVVDAPDSLVRKSEIVVLARPFPEVSWKTLPWDPKQMIFDLDGRIDLSGISARVEGLYWD